MAGYADELLADTKTASPAFADELLNAPVGPGQPSMPPPSDAPTMQFPEAPEFRASEAAGGWGNEQFATMLLSTLGAADDDQLADVAATVFNGQLSKDSFGHKMITLPDGRRMYINKPGASRRDAVSVLSNILPFIPAAKLAMIPRGLASRAATAFGTEAATSAALDVGQTALGSEQGVGLGKAAVTGLTGSAGSLLAAPAGKFFKWLTTRNKYYRNGALTSEGIRVAKAAGYDPDNLGPDLPAILGQNLRRATDEDTAIGMTAGKEFDLNLTTGEAMANPKQMAREEALRHGVQGEEAQVAMLGRRVLQQDSLQDAREGIQRQVGGPVIERPREAFDAVIPGVQARAADADAAVTKAYEAVPDAEILGEGFKGLTKRLHTSIQHHRIFVSPSLYPASRVMLTQTRKIERRINKRMRKFAKADKDVSLVRRDFKDMEMHRRFLITKVNAAKGNAADFSAAVGVKREYDRWMDDMIDAHLFEGSDNALALMKKARKTRRHYAEVFEARDGADRSGKVIEKIISGDRTPEQVMGYAFTTGKGEGVQVIRRLKQIFEPGSDEWRALKEAAWLRIAKETGDAKMSPQKFVTRLNKVMDENETFMKEMFDADEIKTMHRFRDEVKKLIPPPEATRPSKTPYGVEGQVRSAIRRVAQQRQLGRKPFQAFVLHWLGRAPKPRGVKHAEAAMGVGPGRMKAPLFTAAVAGQGRVNEEEVKRGLLTGAALGGDIFEALSP